MSKTVQPQIILLLADGFDEAVVGIVLTRLRQAGLAVSLVGLRSKRVSGAHGLVIIPNASLDRILEAPPPVLALVLPGGAGHLARLRVDPRVSVLIQKNIRDTILVGLDEQATKMVRDLTDTNGEAINIIEPEVGIYMEDFACSLAQRLVGLAAG